MNEFLQILDLIRDGLMQFLQTNPWFTPVVSVFLALLTLGRKFVFKVGQQVLTKVEARLETRADALADWLVSQLERRILQIWWLVSDRFQQRYYQTLIYTLRDYRIQGLKTKGPFVLDLRKVFIPLRLTPESVDKITSALLQRREETGNLGIWDFLAAMPTQMAFRRLVILGSPGSGKSTLVEHITLTYAENRQRQEHRRVPKLIPILLYLRNVKDAISAPRSSIGTVSDPPPTLATLVEQQEWIQALTPTTQWFDTRLKQGRCLVMLDGLDEIADPQQRQQVSQWIARQMNLYPASSFIVTSRPFGYRTAPLEQASTIEVQPFTLTQVEQFLHNWYLQNEIMSRLGRDDPGVRAIATGQARDLIDRIKHTPPLAAMAINPLLLTMIATVHCYRGALPGRRVELYAEICDVLLGRRQEAKGIPDSLTAIQKKTVLQLLALKGMQRETRKFKLVTACLMIQQRLREVAGLDAEPEEFLHQIENTSGLLVEREQGSLEFAHKSFQEYLAACQIKEWGQELLLSRLIEDPWWEETIRLYAAQGDTSYLIQCALDRGTVGTLTLAYDCLEEGLSVDPKVRQQLETTLEQGLEATDPMLFRLAVEVKLSRRLKTLLRLDETTEIDHRFLTCSEYQQFIDEQQVGGEIRRPDDWQGDRFPPGQANQSVLGVRAIDAEAFCQWLTQRTNPLGTTYQEGQREVFTGEFRFRLPTVNEGHTHQPMAPAIGWWSQNGDQQVLVGLDSKQLQTWQALLTNRLREVSAEDYTAASQLAADRRINQLPLDQIEGILQRFEPDLTRLLNLDPTSATLDPTHALLPPPTPSLDPDLIRTLTLVHHRIEMLLQRRQPNGQEELAQGRAYLLLLAAFWQMLAESYETSEHDGRWFPWLRKRTTLKRLQQTRQDGAALSREYGLKRDRGMDCYAFLVLVEERRAGRIPAWEGIRVVKETTSPVIAERGDGYDLR